MPRKKTGPRKAPFIKKVEEILDRQLYSDVLTVEWTTGGETGGSCWDEGDEDRHYAVESEKEPEFEDLDKILQSLCPQITFLQYKALNKDVVQEKDWTDREYYGNYYDKRSKSINLHVLGNYLKEKGLWTE